MKYYGPSSWTDQLWKSGLALLFTMVVLFIAWELASRLLGPLVIILLLFGVMRLAIGVGRRRDGW